MKKVLSVLTVLALAMACIFAQAVSESNSEQKTLTVYAYSLLATGERVAESTTVTWTRYYGTISAS